MFILWAWVLIAFLAVLSGPTSAAEYLESRPSAEPIFVFVVMVIASTRPIIQAAESVINGLYGSATSFSQAR